MSGESTNLRAFQAYAALSVVDDEHDSRTGTAAGPVRTVAEHDQDQAWLRDLIAAVTAGRLGVRHPDR